MLLINTKAAPADKTQNKQRLQAAAARQRGQVGFCQSFIHWNTVTCSTNRITAGVWV